MSRRKNLLHQLNDSGSCLDNSYLQDEPSPLFCPIGRAETKRISVELDAVSDEDEAVKVPRRIIAALESLDTSENDEMYFKTPKASKKPSVNVPDKCTSKRRKNNRLAKTKITRFFNKEIEPKNSKDEQLQTAIALSKSLCSQDSQDACPVALRETLAKFGFRSKSSTSSLENKWNGVEKLSRNKNRHIKPLLLLLTDDRRQSLIQEKIASILSNIDHKATFISAERPSTQTRSVTSEQLAQYACDDNCVFKLHANGASSSLFYVKALPIKPTLVKCGSLLKKWDSIPGREVTPPRETTPGSCWSPDLFESDGEIISSSYIEMKRPKTPLGIDSLTTCPNLVDNFTRRPETESDKDDNDCTALKLHESLSPIVIVSDSDDDLPHCENVDMRVSPVLNKQTERYSDAEKTASNSSSFSESKQVQTSPIDNENIDQSWSFTTQSLSGPNEMQNSVVVVESDDDLDLICSQECQYTSGDELEQYFGSQESPEKLVRQPETPPNDYNLHDDTVLLNERGGDKVVTPQSNLIVKCDNVTPCPDYDRMLTPEVVRELDKFGFKAVKRRKGVKLLKYIYDSTHPLVRVSEKPQVKRKKLDSVRDKTVCSEKCASLESNVEVVGDLLSESASDDVILEKKRCKSKLGCQVPLHIAFHNLISSNPQLKENILMYEPIQLEVVHLMLGQHGYKYQMDDLLSFMDKKCITVKYNQVPTTRRK